MRFLPQIVNNEQAVTILELFSEFEHSLAFIQKNRLVTS
jgi:hypothetical protein